jgi:hypothetical protein
MPAMLKVSIKMASGNFYTCAKSLAEHEITYE